MVNFYSPSDSNKKNNFTKKSLLKMIEIWNLSNNSKITVKSNYSDALLYKLLNNKLKKICGANKYWLWCGVLDRIIVRENIPNLMRYRRLLKAIDKKELRPEKPELWYKNPKTWLSNYDIQNVMNQYSDVKKYNYKFLGVFPIDFAVKNSSGHCLYNSQCNINIANYMRKKIHFIGFITNLDKHDESGSHWTSTFVVINPKLETYGAYYYDSVGSRIPVYVMNYLNDIKAQCNKINPNKPFNIIYNNKQFQYKNTECGVFSMLFQIRWINKHIVKKNNTSFTEIVEGNRNITDDVMVQIRDSLFRPNTKMELKKI